MCHEEMCTVWNVAVMYEFVGLCVGVGWRRPPSHKKIITDFIFFQTVSFTTSDSYWIAHYFVILIHNIMYAYLLGLNTNFNEKN